MPFDMLTCRLDHEEDADIIEFLKQATAKGFSKSYIVKTAIRYYAGILSQSSKDEVNQALLRVIQLEKKFKEFAEEQEDKALSLLTLVQAEIERLRKEREEMKKEIELLKQSYKILEENRKEGTKKEDIKKLKRAYKRAIDETIMNWWHVWVTLYDHGDLESLRAQFEDIKWRLELYLEEDGVELDMDFLIKVLEEEYPHVYTQIKPILEVVLNV